MIIKLIISVMLEFLFFSSAFSKDTKLPDDVKTLKAENYILLKALPPSKLSVLKQPPELLMCSDATPCNCRAGSYGYCTTAKECAEIGGQCY